MLASLIYAVRQRFYALTIILLALLLLVGCSAPTATNGVTSRPFKFGRDTFAYANELVWVYQIDPATGKMFHHDQTPRPDYTHHCFVVARAARQFFENARFDATAPVVDEKEYRRLIDKVAKSNPRQPLAPDHQIVIPGYSNLFSFSSAQEALLKAECGSAMQSYFQRGHWRMIFWFTRSHQEHMARQLAGRLKEGRLPLVHVVRFPSLRINHAMLIYDFKETDEAIEFTAYDPNDPNHPLPLTFNRAQKRFLMPPTNYFPGGRVDIYEIFYAWNY